MAALFIHLRNFPHVHKGNLLYFNSGDHTGSVYNCIQLYSTACPVILQALETAVHHSVNLSDSQHSQPDFEIKLKRKFEPSEMAQVFYGRIMKVVYIFVLSIYCFLAAWSFSTVAGSAWAANLPFSTNVTPTLQKCDYNEFKDTLVPASIECLNVYRLCIFFFGVVSVILSMLELTEQKILQIFLGLLRFVTIGSMVIYSIVRLIQTHGEAPHSANSTQGNTPNMTLGEAFVHFKFNYWLVAIPVFVYSQITHQGIATLTAPVVPKKRLGRFFIAIISTTCIIYTVLGVTVAMYWQESIQETSTLNWVSFVHERCTYLDRYTHTWWYAPVDVHSSGCTYQWRYTQVEVPASGGTQQWRYMPVEVHTSGDIH